MLVVHLLKTKKKLRSSRKLETHLNWKFIYKNDLDKACFQHDMFYGKYRDLTEKILSGNVLREKLFEIASNPRFDGYQRGLASLVYRFLEKKS